MNSFLPNIRTARELATRLKSVFGLQPLLITMSPKGLKVDCEDRKSSDWDSGEEIARFDRTWIALALGQMNLESQRSYATSFDGRLQLLMHLSQDIENPILLYLDLDGHSELVVRSLVATHVEAILWREDANASKNLIDSFIGQVTQDFEELSWLRNANEYLDLCDAKHPLMSIAWACLPDLAQVIRAQTILYVPAALRKTTHLAKATADQIFATGPSDAALSVCTQFIHESIGDLNGGPLVLNSNSSQQNLPGYEGLRNCILVPITKGPKTYGWLLAVNKTSQQNHQGRGAMSLYLKEETHVNETSLQNHQGNPSEGEGKLKENSFGTFEASLLVAASNIMSAQGRNLDFFELQELLLTGVVRAIINAIDAKDTYTCGHSDRVAAYAKRIAKRMGLSDDECERVFMAGVLHDVGKIGVPDAILSKPGKLTDFEFEIVKQHPRIGFEILEHLKQLNYVLPGVLHHHEAYDGSGYPSGLVGEDIPLHGRILAVADAYDAMTSNRPYRSGMPHAKAEAILRAEAGKTWDSKIVEVFLECLAEESVRNKAESTSISIGSSENSDAPSTQPNTHLMWRISSAVNTMITN